MWCSRLLSRARRGHKSALYHRVGRVGARRFMSDLLVAAYPWIKALHIVAVVAWMAGLLYLPRLFVYHADAVVGSDKAETFKVMEWRLLRGIMLPAVVMVLVFGVLLAVTPGVVDWRQGWI